VPIGLVWIGLFFIHSVTRVTLDMSIRDYSLYITTQLIWTAIQYSNIKLKDQLEVESITTSRYICTYINIPKS